MSNPNETARSADAKRQWSPPRVQRMAAGSAENGNRTVNDGADPS